MSTGRPRILPNSRPRPISSEAVGSGTGLKVTEFDTKVWVHWTMFEAKRKPKKLIDGGGETGWRNILLRRAAGAQKLS